MGTRGRRRIDLALLAAAALLTGVVALVGAVAGRTERVPRLWAGAAVGPGGAARVVEAIDYDFGSRQRHGIYRDIPGLAAGDPVQVASPTAPAQLQVTGTSQQARLRIGDPDRTVSGRHRYTIGYRLAGAGAAAAVRAWELRVRTPAGSGLWLRTESFRRFLAGSEAHHAEEAAQRGHLREYTAWAVAVGELDRWSRAAAGSSTARADPAAARYPLLAPALVSGTSGSSARPSSSGSGSGGGVGGGGGGSW